VLGGTFLGMPNWKQIIVGDAFKLPSRNPRYYLDLVLIVPLFFAGLFLFESIHTRHISGWDLKRRQSVVEWYAFVSC
jgi:hypothetical protein